MIVNLFTEGVNQIVLRILENKEQIDNLESSVNLNRIYKIVNLISIDKKENYIFIGEIYENKETLSNIFTKIEKGEELSQDENALLIEKYGDNYQKYFGLDELNIVKVKLIYDLIYPNDSIELIKLKILIYISDVSQQNIILPEDQNLYIQNFSRPRIYTNLKIIL